MSHDMVNRPRTRHAMACVTLVMLGACAKSSPTPPVQTTTITITSSGVTPNNVIIGLGQRVRFVNNDVRPHNMASDPHPEHNDCPEFDQVGFLAPGQSRETGNLVTVRTCGFHDHDLPESVPLTGTVTIR
jgi:plastocyanin